MQEDFASRKNEQDPPPRVEEVHGQDHGVQAEWQPTHLWNTARLRSLHERGHRRHQGVQQGRHLRGDRHGRRARQLHRDDATDGESVISAAVAFGR
uniref:Uncharacterized protein n=1 Tax=Steinernema glaseri TaxID=37863 RepID=A0A1I8AAR9_9BILA